MPKNTLTPQQQVTEHIQKIDPSIRDVIEMLRQIILGTSSEIAEQIKWNNPSFYYTGEMAPFDPKEYKRDIIVMNLYKKRIMLVFPSGAKINDTSGLLEGDYKDGRRLAIFKDMADVKAKADALQYVIKQWLSLMYK
ncbi:MAG: DUF1801 domain-containing protein [Mucilaginibacter sp.]|jgi:hypothetical protein|uniref:DUF1801 domain-containing protein n=1 Tax=Mucilaginibacter sp. TaxID=1882438 RepID=UPI003563E250